MQHNSATLGSIAALAPAGQLLGGVLAVLVDFLDLVDWPSLLALFLWDLELCLLGWLLSVLLVGEVLLEVSEAGAELLLVVTAGCEQSCLDSGEDLAPLTSCLVTM